MRQPLSSISSASSGSQVDFESLSAFGSARISSRRRGTVRGVDPEPAARPRPLRLTQARIGDTLHDGNGTRVGVVNAFTTVNPDTETIVRAVDYHVVGAPEQFRVYSDDVGDIARWMRVDMSAAAGEESV